MNSSTTETITIGNIAGKLPYNHLVFKGEDPRITLITTCLQVLCVVLDFQSGAARDSNVDGQAVPSAKTNAFRYFVVKLVSCVLSEMAVSMIFFPSAPFAGFRILV